MLQSRKKKLNHKQINNFFLLIYEYKEYPREICSIAIGVESKPFILILPNIRGYQQGKGGRVSRYFHRMSFNLTIVLILHKRTKSFKENPGYFRFLGTYLLVPSRVSC